MEYKLVEKEQQQAFVMGYKPESEKLVWISPSRFLRAVPSTIYDQHNLEQLKAKLEAGVALDPVFVDITPDCTITNHEGRHRAKAAMDLGIQKIPTVFFCRKHGNFLPKEECKCPIMGE